MKRSEYHLRWAALAVGWRYGFFSIGRISWVRWRFRFSTGRSFRPESSSRSPRSTFRVIQSIPVHCFRAVVASVVASWTKGLLINDFLAFFGKYFTDTIISCPNPSCSLVVLNFWAHRSDSFGGSLLRCRGPWVRILIISCLENAYWVTLFGMS